MRFHRPTAMQQVTAYPLMWPPEQARTPSSKRLAKRWRYNFTTAAQDLADECRMSSIHDFVLSCGRQPGTASWMDVGAVLWFMQRIGDAYAVSYMACDRFRDGTENVKAIAMTLQRLRQINDYGCYSVERAMRGAAYDALPPPQTAKPKRPWWDVLGVTATTPRVVIDAAYKALAKTMHPDKGGSAEEMAELNAAYSEATK